MHVPEQYCCKVLVSGLAIKNPPKKPHPIKPQKTPLKPPPQSGFFLGFIGFFKTVFGAKVTIFLVKCLRKSLNLGCN
jgi:hypothetical protein